MTNLFEAIREYKEAVLNGDDVTIQEVAQDYDLNPILLERKIKESYPKGFGAIPTLEENTRKKFTQNLTKMCVKYDVDEGKTFDRIIDGKKYRMVCWFANRRNNPWIAIGYEDGKVWRIKPRMPSHMNKKGF